MLRYAITDRTLFPGDEPERQNALLRHCSLLATRGIDYIQLREKDLPPPDQVKLARSILAAIQASASDCRLLVNSRADVAIASAAHGVHLTAAPGSIPGSTPAGLTASQVRTLYQASGLPRPVISASCHTVAEVKHAVRDGAGLILFGPVFGKQIGGRQVTPPLGLETLRTAVAAARDVPLLALGGIGALNQASCMDQGAAGIASIRLFGPDAFRPDRPPIS